MDRRSGDRTQSASEPEIDSSRRRFLGVTAGATATALLSGAGTAAAQSDGETVTIVHDTHFHGRFESTDAAELNVAAYYAVVEEHLESTENSLFVGNGDDLAPSMLGLEYEGEHMIEALNYMDLDVDGVGNHEYDFGADVATERFEQSEFPWVVANLLDENGEAVPGTERWVTLEEGGLTVGVFGLVSTNFHSLTDYPAEWQVLGYVEAATEAVDALREAGADVVVCASHVSTGVHDTIAAEVDGLDAIVGSHSDITLDEPEIVDGTVVSEFGDEFDHVGSITLDANGDLVDWQRTDLLLPDWDPAPEAEESDRIVPRYTDEIEPDETLAGLAEEWTAELEERLGQPAFESEVELNASWDNYAIETNWGNLMTDAMRTIGEIGDVEVDIAAQNAGGIRGGSTLGPGEITGADVMNVLPFPNEIQVVELTGRQVVDYLESEIRPHPSEEYGVQPAIQVSGVSYEWWGHEGETWVDNVFVGGEPVDPDETYYLAHNDYTIENSDVLSAAEVVIASGQFQGPYVLDRLEERDTVAPERENRMLRVDETVDEAAVDASEDEITLTVDVPAGAAEIAPETLRAVIRTGDDLPADSASVDGETVDVTFDAAALRDLADVDEPALRLYGRYEPDQDHWPYEFDVPTSDGYDRFQFRAAVDATALSSDDGNGTDGGTDDPEDDDDGDGDGVPGFGAVAALTGGGAGAYLYARSRAGDDATDDGTTTDDGA